MASTSNLWKKYLAKIQRSWKGRGLFGSIILIFNKLKYSVKFMRFDFNGSIHPGDLDGPEEVRIHAVKYEASNHSFFLKLFDGLQWPYQESTFIDFGCGKGASLVYASQLGFKKVIGVEFSASLAETAIKNMQRFSAQKSCKTEYEIVHANAALYEIPPEADCFYFFNPFDAVILDQVMQHIQHSLAIRNRRIIILYLNALHHDCIEKYPFRSIKFLPAKELDIYFNGGAHVYENV